MPLPKKSEERVARVSLLRPGIAISTLTLTLFFTGCKPVGPNYQRPGYSAPPAYKETGATAVTFPPPPPPSGGGWQPASPSDGMLRGKWWEIYNDPKLDELEERVTTYNQTIRAALFTYQAALEQVHADRADFSPTLLAGPSFAHEKVSAHRPFSSDFSHSASNYNNIQLTGQASWEPDFWGRIRRTVEAANASAQASNAEMASVDLSLHAELAEAYFELRGLDTQAQLLQSDIEKLSAQLDLTHRRLAGGIGTEADVAQAQTLLDSTRAQLIEVSVTRTELEHLVGSIAIIKVPFFSLPPIPFVLDSPAGPGTTLPKIPIGIPSQLLERRPDIAAAERRAAQANAQIGIAVSAFYPTLSLTGTGGFQSTHGGTWIQGPSALWSLGAQAAQLLLDGGRRKAYSNQARDLWEASASTYKGTVFLAFNEVENKLGDLRILEQEETAQRAAVQSAQHSLDIANTRYKGGVTGYLEVLTAENALIQAERTLAALRSRQFASSVELIRALGGGWDTSQIPK